MSMLTKGQNAAGVEPTTNAALGTSWLSKTSDTATGSLMLFGGSEYVSRGQMKGASGNVLTVFVDRWGGNAANHIVAPEMVLAWPDNWGDAAGKFLQAALETPAVKIDIPCSSGCGGPGPSIPETSRPICLIDCDGGALIELQPVPEPQTAWIVGVCVVALLLWKRIRCTRTWMHN